MIRSDAPTIPGLPRLALDTDMFLVEDYSHRVIRHEWRHSLGLLFYHHRENRLTSSPQARSEDGIYVHPAFSDQLHALGTLFP